MIYLDTETCGLHGPIVIIQWAEDNGDVQIHSVWTNPISETMELIETICNHPGGVCGFNLAFDWFHICQLYTTLYSFSDWSVEPIDHIDTYVKYEEKARFLNICLKPYGAFDIMLHARKGLYQSTMNRADIRIKRIPTLLAHELAQELTDRIPLPDIYFARKKNPGQRWQVFDIEDDFGDIEPEFKDIVLKFAPSSALKALYAAVTDESPDAMLQFRQVEPKYRPKELGYAPFALANGNAPGYGGAWPIHIRDYVRHWVYYAPAR